MTAVEWLVEQLLIYGDKAFNKEISLGQYHIKKQELIEQAKQMEKEQIITANEDSSTNESGEFLTGEQYYNKMYGNKNDDHTEQHLEMVSSQPEISDEEIENEADHYREASGSYSFKMAIKWYREQLKKK